jgi:chromosome segregation ATPase
VNANDDEAEERAAALALGLLAAVGDAKAARLRLEQLVGASAEHDRKLAAATAAIAEAEARSTELTKAETSLTQRIADFQNWVDGTERSYRSREDHVRRNEEAQGQRERSLVEQESDLDRRTAAHQQRVASLRETLA